MSWFKMDILSISISNIDNKIRNVLFGYSYEIFLDIFAVRDLSA